MEGWLAVVQKIVLGIAIAGIVGGLIYTAVSNWADDNVDGIANPKYGYKIQFVEDMA